MYVYIYMYMYKYMHLDGSIASIKSIIIIYMMQYVHLDPSCKKSCDLIGQEQVSISHINL